MEEHYLTLDEIKAIPGGEYPFMVFADNIRGFFSLGVKLKTKGSWGHFMWLVGSDRLATQGWTFHTTSLDTYAGCNLKIISTPGWTAEERKKLIDAIEVDVRKPWYLTLYDWPAILGQLLGLDWFQSKWHRICSECVNYLSLVDGEFAEWFKVEHTPTPADVNAWFKSRPERFRVFGRYTPD